MIQRTFVFHLLINICVLAVVLSCSDALFSGAKAQLKGQKVVKVYFYHDPGEYIDLSPVTRSVNANTPARAAIEMLLKGPTAAERRQGFDSLIGANYFRIGSLTINGGTARINFVSSRKWLGWPGDLAPVRFKTAVELTLKQFASVEMVIVSLDGDSMFDDER